MGDQEDPLIYTRRYAAVPIIGVGYFGKRDLPQLIQQFVEGKKTLDYGCGTGRITRFLKSLNMDVDGVDINEHMINYSKELDPNGRYHVIESAKVPTDSEYYDLVHTSFVLIYCKSKSDMLMIVKEAARILKPGGILIIVGTNSDVYYKTQWLHDDTDFEENKNVASGSVVKMVYRDHVYTTYHYYWTDEDYQEVIVAAGLHLIHVHKPLGNDTDGFAWVNEKEFAMAAIYVAKKENGKKNAKEV